jgi:hypothetical protein
MLALPFFVELFMKFNSLNFIRYFTVSVQHSRCLPLYFTNRVLFCPQAVHVFHILTDPFTSPASQCPDISFSRAPGPDRSGVPNPVCKAHAVLSPTVLSGFP